MPIINNFCQETMKTLLILRHAKSSWDDPSLDDHDRPLNARGLNTAPLMGKLIKEENLTPDIILSSTAVRASETAKLIAQHSVYAGKIQTLQTFYPGSTDDYLEALSGQDGKASTIMIVGHNPGLEIFLEHLTGRKELLPTTALAQVQLPIDSWIQLTVNTKGSLKNIYRPKEIFK